MECCWHKTHIPPSTPTHRGTPHAHLTTEFRVVLWNVLTFLPREDDTVQVLLLVGQLLLWSVNTPSLQLFIKQWQTQEPGAVDTTKPPHPPPSWNLFFWLLWPHSCTVCVYLSGRPSQFPRLFLSFHCSVVESRAPLQAVLTLFLSFLLSSSFLFSFPFSWITFICSHGFDDCQFSNGS